MQAERGAHAQRSSRTRSSRVSSAVPSEARRELVDVSERGRSRSGSREARRQDGARRRPRKDGRGRSSQSGFLPQQLEAVRDIRQPGDRFGGGPGGIPSSRNTWGAASKSSSVLGSLRRLLPVLIAALLLVFAASNIYSCASGKLAGGERDGQGGQPAEAPVPASYDPSVESVASVPASGETLVGFSLAEGDADTPSMSDSQLAAVKAVLAHYEPSERTVGFMMLDLETGRGWAYNVDAEVYGRRPSKSRWRFSPASRLMRASSPSRLSRTMPKKPSSGPTTTLISG